MPPVRVIFIAALVMSAAGSLRAASLREASGLVQVRAAGGDNWRPAGKTPRTVAEGDGIRTGFNARMLLILDGGSQLEATGNAHVSIEVDSPGHTTINALFGTVRMSARAENGRVVAVRTPTCVARARSARSVYRVAVGGGGGTIVEVLEGGVGVEDNRGRSVLVTAGQRIDADVAGIHEATAAPTPVQARKIDFTELMRRELGFELKRDADFVQVARENRRAERELGRLLMDADGMRVRVEEYVVRPSADRVNLVTLNGRGDGMSYAGFDATFDRALPANLEPVMANLRGGAAATAWTLSSFTRTFSNGARSLTEQAAGGHQVDVNANADPLDDEGTGTAFRTIFDRYGVYADGALKRGFTGANLQQYSDKVDSTVNDPITGAVLGAALPVVVINNSAPDAGAARRVTNESYGDGTTITREELYLEFGGGVGPRAGFGAADRSEERRITVGGTTIKITGSSNAAYVTELVR